MGIITKVMETIVQFVPDKKPDSLLIGTNYISQPINRVDGHLKVTGEATFSAEYKLDNITHASVVYSTIAKGSINKIDTSAAIKSEGVITVITYKNSPKINKPVKFEPGGKSKGSAASELPVMEDATIYWNGQPIALIIADTLEHAEHAASLVRVDYKKEKSDVSFDALKNKAKTPPNVLNEPAEVKIGDAEDGLKNAA